MTLKLSVSGEVKASDLALVIILLKHLLKPLSHRVVSPVVGVLAIFFDIASAP